MYTADSFHFRYNMEKTNRKRGVSKSRKKDTAAAVPSSKSQPPLKRKRTNKPSSLKTQSINSSTGKQTTVDLADKVDELSKQVGQLTNIVTKLTNSASNSRENTSFPGLLAAEPDLVAPDRDTASINDYQQQSKATDGVTHGVEDIQDDDSVSHAGECIKVNSIMAPPTRPVLLASGAQAGVRVPTRIKQKIWLHKYVDFHDILHPESDNTYYMSLSDSDNFPKINFRPNKRRPLTEAEWGSAWDDFTAIYTKKYPEQLNDLITYGKTVKEFMRLGQNWQYYDSNFRIDREYTKCSWAALRVDLQINASKSNFRSQSTNKSYQQNSKRPPTGYCFAYHNISQRCTYQNCTYKHTCPTCDQRHPMFRPCNQYQHQYQRQGQSTSGYVNKAKKNHQTKQTPNTPSVNRDQPPANTSSNTNTE